MSDVESAGLGVSCQSLALGTHGERPLMPRTSHAGFPAQRPLALLPSAQGRVEKGSFPLQAERQSLPYDSCSHFNVPARTGL